MIVDRSDVSEYSPNVLGQRAGQAIERITANRSARNTTAWIPIGRDPLGCLIRSLSKYVKGQQIRV
jgi:hypothetical protein